MRSNDGHSLSHAERSAFAEIVDEWHRDRRRLLLDCLVGVGLILLGLAMCSSSFTAPMGAAIAVFGAWRAGKAAYDASPPLRSRR